jgi:hypothetical protein
MEFFNHPQSSDPDQRTIIETCIGYSCFSSTSELAESFVTCAQPNSTGLTTVLKNYLTKASQQFMSRVHLTCVVFN